MFSSPPLYKMILIWAEQFWEIILLRVFSTNIAIRLFLCDFYISTLNNCDSKLNKLFLVARLVIKNLYAAWNYYVNYMFLFNHLNTWIWLLGLKVKRCGLRSVSSWRSLWHLLVPWPVSLFSFSCSHWEKTFSTGRKKVCNRHVGSQRPFTPRPFQKGP